MPLAGMGVDQLLAPLPLAIAAGLFLGKQVGIFAAIFVADRIGFAPRPDQATWPEIWGVSILCGIGFTMSLFISGLAFAGQQLLINEAKIGILLGSLISALAGYAIIRMSAKHPDDVRSPYID
jgi:NhaA family Na+:H+ antiporter